MNATERKMQIEINDLKLQVIELRKAAWFALEELSQWQGMDDEDEGTQEAIDALKEVLGVPDNASN